MMTQEQREKVNARLSEKLDPAAIRERKGRGKTSLSYVEGHYVIRRLNEIFGFGGWSDDVIEVVQLADLHRTDSEGRPKVEPQFRATVALNVSGLRPDGRDWSTTDVGYGGGDHEKGVKEAVTDALKRCARKLGDGFGLALYEKPDEDGNRTHVAAPEKKAKAPSARAVKAAADDAVEAEVAAVVASIEQAGGDAAKLDEIKGRIKAMKASAGPERFATMVDAWKAAVGARTSEQTKGA